MYKVLIVDDEPLIREGLSTLIEWQEYGFEVVHAAKDGMDALKLYEQYQPDLLIVDIRMPGMDGLQLIETIRQKHWTPKLLILSGYADFEYAKKAIHYKVEGYILKPVDEDELIEYLQDIKQALDREREEQEHVSALSDKHREALILSVLTGDQPFTESISSRASELDLIWKQYQVLLLLIQFDNERQMDVISGAEGQLRDWIQAEQSGVVFTRDFQLGVLLRESYVTRSQLDKLYNRLHEMWQDSNIAFHASVGQTVYRFVDIKTSYDEAFAYMKRRFFAERKKILGSGTAPELHAMIEQEGHAEVFEAPPYIDKLYYAMDIVHKDSIKKILDQMKKDMIAADMSEQQVKTSCMQILTTVTNKLLAGNESLRTTNEREATSWIVQLYRYTTIHEMFSMIERRLTEFVDRKGMLGSDTLVKRMIDLIDRNYHENLKLESLAEVFNYNSAYLGKLFKNHTGEYFNTYLDKVRIDQAKNFLEEGLKVYQVAERVGYTNVDYFHSKFKKYTGISPSAYRSEHSS